MLRVWICGGLAVCALSCQSTSDKRYEASRDTAAALTEGSFGQGELSVTGDGSAERLSRALALVDSIERGERTVGELAKERAASKDVKDFAETLRGAHDQYIESLQRLLEEQHMALGDVQADPLFKATEATAQAARTQLQGLRGAAFDAAFIALEPHTQALLQEVAREARDLATDASVKGYLDQVEGAAKADEAKAQRLLPTQCGGAAGAATKDESDTPARYVPPGAVAPDAPEVPYEEP